MRFGAWSVMSLCRSGSLKMVGIESIKYRLDLVSVQKVRWEKGSTEQAEDYTFLYGEGNDDCHLGTGFFHTQENHIRS
jgi:hypothetical protein